MEQVVKKSFVLMCKLSIPSQILKHLTFSNVLEMETDNFDVFVENF